MSTENRPTMHLEDIEQVVNQTLEDLLLGHGSFRHIRMAGDYVSVEFAAFSDDQEVVETIRENFGFLCRRKSWSYCNIAAEPSTNRITVTMAPEKIRVTIVGPEMPRRQPALLPN